MPTRVGEYQLIEQLGAGGMGSVWLAVDQDGNSVAVKLLTASRDNMDTLLRFTAEGAVLYNLRHPNIVQTYGSGNNQNNAYIVMELIQGGSLHQLMKTQHLSLARIKNIVRQVASALGYAHQKGIIHRDIKPDNILLVDDDHVKVSDFGIARIASGGLPFTTATNVSMGTPLYNAPEQIRESHRVDGRADLYSLGAVMYHLVTGRPPFEGKSVFEVQLEHVNRQPDPPSTVKPDVPRDWDDVILKALQKDPNDRFASPAEMEQAIAALSTGETVRDRRAEDRRGIADRADTRDDATAENVGPNSESEDRRERERVITPTPAPSKSRLPLVGGGIVAAIALLLAGFFVVHQGAASVPTPVPRARGNVPRVTGKVPKHGSGAVSTTAAIKQAIARYYSAREAALGQSHDTSGVDAAMVGKAHTAVDCIISREATQGQYYTFQQTEKVSDVRPSGAMATAVVQLRGSRITHTGQGKTTSSPNNHTVTFTLVRSGGGWRVSDYRLETGFDAARECS